MATPIFLKGLELFVEANELAGADGAEVSSFTDLSGHNRHLTAASAKPLIKADAVNSKKSVIWDGAKNPLKYSGSFTIRCGFLLVKVNGEFSGDYQGILTSLENYGILVGIGGANVFYDFLYDFYEFRLNDRIYPQTDAPAPVDAFGIIYFKFWQNLTVEGIQLGQDRNFADRKFDGEVALAALYNRDFCEAEVRKMTQSIANSYQIALPDVFPFQGSKTDAVTTSKRVLSDGQDEPVLRVKRGARKLFDLNFAQRSQGEMAAAESFWNDFYPQGRFIYRDYELIPPVDTICRFPENSEFQRTGGNSIWSMNYGFQAFESVIAPATGVPPPPAIPDETPDEPETPPDVPTGFAATVESSTSILLTWDTAEAPSAPVLSSATPDSSTAITIDWTAAAGIVTGYETRIDGGAWTDRGNVLTFQYTGLTPATEYDFEVRAYNDAGASAASNLLSATTDAGGAFSPDDISGLKLWLEADAIAGLSDGDFVTSWLDSSVAGNDFSASVGAQPTFQTNEINSLPVVRFDGSNDGMVSASIAALTNWTVFFVIKNANTSSSYILSAGADTNSIISEYTSGKYEFYSPQTAIGNTSTSVFQVISGTVGSTTTGAWYLGQRAGGSYWGGDLAEVIVYDSVLSGGDITSVTTYLETKYGL